MNSSIIICVYMCLFKVVGLYLVLHLVLPLQRRNISVIWGCRSNRFSHVSR